MKVYISGPITGLPNKNKEAFDSLGCKLRELGFEVLNPFDLDYPGFNSEGCWFKYMQRDLAQLVYCNAVCLLPGWEESKGARLEVTIAKQLNMPVFRLQEDMLVEEPVAIDIEITPLIPSYLWE